MVSESTAASVPADTSPCWGVEFDFLTKACRPVAVADVMKVMDHERFVWLDIDSSRSAEARKLLTDLNLIRESVIEEIFTKEPATQLARYDEYIHLVLSACRLEPDGGMKLERIDAVLSERFLFTIHSGSQPVIEAVKRDYRADFLRFAKTPSFLLYEVWDHLVDHYLSIQKGIELRVEQLQAELFRDVGDDVFVRVAEIGASLLHFRSVLVPARAVLNELATRRMLFVSEATQTFLSNMVGTIERVLQDVLVDRDSLAQSLNLHMSMLSHRTNRAMNRLTVISTIFLPLSFVCGIYGMNFDNLPELHWPNGYLFFWGICASIVVIAVIMIKKSDLL
jgi:magnesium transporter